MLAQQVFFSQRDFTAGQVDSFSDDAWDNDVVERNGLRDHLVEAATSNPVVLTGDVHEGSVKIDAGGVVVLRRTARQG